MPKFEDRLKNFEASLSFVQDSVQERNRKLENDVRAKDAKIGKQNSMIFKQDERIDALERILGSNRNRLKSLRMTLG